MRQRLHGQFRPKPSIQMLRVVLAREGLAGRANAGRAVLVDDSLTNLKAARAAGFSAVLRIGPAARRPLRWRVRRRQDPDGAPAWPPTRLS
jgi:FMN phosphatase YigB (HAD superfamily)